MSAVLKGQGQAANTMWQFRPLAEVADILDSQRIPVNTKERATRQGSVPYYGATGQVGWIDDHIFDEELVLLGEDGAPFLKASKQKAYVVRGKSWVNNHAHVLRAREVPAGWLAHYLNSISYEGLVTGTTRLKLTQAAMRQINVPVAPSQIMESIVAEIEKQFSRLDEAVANLKRIKANLKRYKAAALKAAVEGRLVATEAELARREGRSYETGTRLLQHILDVRRRELRGKRTELASPDTTDLPALPAGWGWASIDQIAAETQIGLDRGREVQNEECRGSPYVKMNNVNLDGNVSWDDLVYVEASNDEQQRFGLRDGDVLFNTRNSKELVGKVGLVLSPPAKAVYNNNLMRIRFAGDVLPSFVCAQMCSAGFKARMETVKRATTNVAAVYAKDLLPLAIAVPPTDEQRRIVTELDQRFSLVRKLEVEVEVNLKRAQALRSAALAIALRPPLLGRSPYAI